MRAGETVAVIDFETTGLSPDMGARPTEIGVVLVRDGCIVDRYQSLMNAGVHVPFDIEALTGISNAMVRGAPQVARVMQEAADFVGDHPLVAHNAAFDRKFWDAELLRLGRSRAREFACSMLLARRLFPEAASHSLGSLVRALDLPAAERYHRALADAEAAAHLLICLQTELKRRFALPGAEHDLLVRVQRVARGKLDDGMERRNSVAG